MRRMIWFTVIVLVCGSLCGCERRAMFGKSDEAAIRELFTEYQKDWNAHDTQAMGSLFTDDAQWINVVGMHWSGKPDIVKAHEIYHRFLFQKTGIKFLDVSIQPITPDVAIAVVPEDFDTSLLPDGGTRPASKDILSFILVKRDGQWKIVHGHNTIVVPEARPYDPVNSGWNGGKK